MCDICNSERINTYMFNGKNDVIYSERLYRVFRDKYIHIKLCYLHSIDLFCNGESAFLRKYLKYSRSIVQKDPDNLY